MVIVMYVYKCIFCCFANFADVETYNIQKVHIELHIYVHSYISADVCMKQQWNSSIELTFLGRRRRPYIVFRNRFLCGFMFVYIYI